MSDEPQEADTAIGTRGGGWYLETMAEAGRLRRIAIHPLPFRVGRRQGLELVLPADSVSKNHAEIYDVGIGPGPARPREQERHVRQSLARRRRRPGGRGHPPLRRLRVPPGPVRREGDGPAMRPSTTAPRRWSRSAASSPHHFVEGTRELRELLRDGMVTMVFQPIVHLPLPERWPGRYEALGRGRHPHLPESPLELFRIAESIGAEAELSRLFRRKAVELAREREDDLPTIFLNTHPIELDATGAARVARGAARGRPPARPRPRDPRERPHPPRARSPSCGRCSSSATSPWPTTTSARARPGCSSSPTRLRTT